MRAHRTITILAVLVAAASVANGGETTVVSTDSSGNLGNFGIDPNFAVDETGTLVFFASFSNDLVSGDTNGKSDVFLKDLSSGTTTRIVMGLNGAEPNGRCEWVDVSSDGLFVAFTSDADNLVQGDKNSLEDVFVLDRRADTIERVSVSSTGAEANNVPVEGPSISDDGRYVLFTTFADNLVAGDSAFTRDVFLRDRKSGTTVCVSVDPNGNPGTANSLLGGITGKGTTAFFSSDSSMLVSRDDNGVRDCFMRDLTAGVTERVSLAPDGSELDGDSYSVSFTDDLDWIAFTSNATNLMPGLSNTVGQIYLLNLNDRRVFHVSRSSAGEAADIGSLLSRIAYLSTRAGNEPIVTFLSLATNLGPGRGSPAISDVWAHRPWFGTTQVLDVASDGTAGDGEGMSFTTDAVKPGAGATFALIASDSSNLVPGDDNESTDLFRRDLLWTTFEEFGVGKPGSGGFTPHLLGLGGSCEAGLYSIHVEDGFGGARGFLWVGLGQTDVPGFGGRFYIDLKQPYVALPIVLAGASGVAGAGTFDLDGGDVSDLGPLTVYLQCAFADPGANKKVSLTNGLALHIGE